LLANVQALAQRGLRVIGVASATFGDSHLPGEQHDFAFALHGLIGLADPVRPTVAQAVRECYSASIRVIMITGDYPETARTIARQIGLRNSAAVMTGDELNALDDHQLLQRIRTTNVCARVVPEQKLRIVNALKSAGEIVAMTGDGVNDAPALKSSHIGIAMGMRGTDVARESAELVLVDDDFSSIVAAVRMGRRIFDNLRKAMAYIFSIHVPIAGMSLVPVLLGYPPLLLPVHIVFLELIIDPACSVVFEAEDEEPDIMCRPPRPQNERLCTRSMVGLSLLQGVSVLVMLLVVFGITLWLERGQLEARAMVFTTLIVANLCLILTNRSWAGTIASTLRTRNMALTGVLAGALFFLVLVLYVPFLRQLFRFTTLHPVDLAICIGAGIISILWFEIAKALHRWHAPRAAAINKE
jgi:Ca2+-transporting ATPase